MNRWTTVFLGLLATSAVLFLVLTPRWRFSPERTIQPGTPLFTFSPADITSFRLRNGDLSMEVEKSGDGWRLVKPIQDAASPEVVEALFRAALDCEVADRIDASEVRDEKKLATHGVLKSTQQIDFRGDLPPALLIGKATADGRRIYVSFKNSNTLYLVPSDLAKWLSLPPEALRDTRLTGFHPADLQEIQIRQGRQVLTLERSGDGWHVIKPARFPADPLVVAEWLRKLFATRLSKLADKPDAEPPGDDHERGLELTLKGGDGSRVETIRISPQNADGVRSARLMPRGVEGLLPPATEFTLDLETLRDRSLARLNPDTLDLIRIRRGDGAEVRWERRDGDWNAGNDRVTALLALMLETRAEVLAEEPDPRPADYTISLYSKLSENTPEENSGEQLQVSLAISGSREGALVLRETPAGRTLLRCPATLMTQLKSLLERSRRSP